MLIPPVGAKRELGDGATCGLRTVRVRKSRPGLGSAAILLAEMISAGPVRLGFSTGSDVVSTVTGGNSMAASRSVKSTLRRWPSAKTKPVLVPSAYPNARTSMRYGPPMATSSRMYRPLTDVATSQRRPSDVLVSRIVAPGIGEPFSRSTLPCIAAGVTHWPLRNLGRQAQTSAQPRPCTAGLEGVQPDIAACDGVSRRWVR